MLHNLHVRNQESSHHLQALSIPRRGQEVKFDLRVVQSGRKVAVVLEAVVLEHELLAVGQRCGDGRSQRIARQLLHGQEARGNPKLLEVNAPESLLRDEGAGDAGDPSLQGSASPQRAARVSYEGALGEQVLDGNRPVQNEHVAGELDRRPLPVGCAGHNATYPLLLMQTRHLAGVRGEARPLGDQHDADASEPSSFQADGCQSLFVRTRHAAEGDQDGRRTGSKKTRKLV
eukprot:319020-Hanusia_phi.AAC.3